MCRHLAYLGPSTTLHDLVWAPEHSLVSQASAPRLQAHGRINADGYGVGWYAPGRVPPVRFRRAAPIWSDASFASVAQATTSGCVVAAIRSATVGMPVEESCTAPFTWGSLLFSHNGRALEHPRLRKALLPEVPPDCPEAYAPVDSALLFGLTVAGVQAGRDLPGALAHTVEVARQHSDGRYNLLATDGDVIAATTCGDTLFTLRADDAVLVASEPIDGRLGWEPVPDDSLVVAAPGAVRVGPLRGTTTMDGTAP
jgi:gamma-glutamyl hercynylcysteine S-oxide hydrolase